MGPGVEGKEGGGPSGCPSEPLCAAARRGQGAGEDLRGVDAVPGRVPAEDGERALPRGYGCRRGRSGSRRHSSRAAGLRASCGARGGVRAAGIRPSASPRPPKGSSATARLTCTPAGPTAAPAPPSTSPAPSTCPGLRKVTLSRGCPMLGGCGAERGGSGPGGTGRAVRIKCRWVPTAAVGAAGWAQRRPPEERPALCARSEARVGEPALRR